MASTDELLFEYLRRNTSLSPEDVRQLIAIAPVRSFKKDTILLREGQYSRNEYFVLKGCLRAYYMVDGEEKTTEFYTEFEPIAPTCVVTKEASSYYLSCIEDSILLVSDPSLQQNTFEQFPHLERICRVMTEQVLARKQIALNHFKIRNPEQRYLDLLASHPDLIQRVPQYQLASYLGITPQSLSRLRSRLAGK